jgi:four helix bundle protein
MERFGFEGFDVFDYGAELWSLADDIARRIRPERRHLADQLERASHSIVLNIAEAAGRYSPGAKANAYRIARGSANETAAIFVLLERKGLISEAEATHARRLLLSIIAMLSRLAINFERKALLARPGNVGHNPRKTPRPEADAPKSSPTPGTLGCPPRRPTRRPER